MRDRAPLALIEQAVMLLVFALAAALCLKAFIWADGQSRQSADRDMALLEAQSAAEVLKANGGDYTAAVECQGGMWDGRVWKICYDDRWDRTEVNGTYELSAIPGDKELEYLGTAVVEVRSGDRILVRLPVSWQEVD